MNLQAIFFKNANFNSYEFPFPLPKSTIKTNLQIKSDKLNYMKYYFNYEQKQLNNSEFQESNILISTIGTFIANYVAVQFYSENNTLFDIKFYKINDYVLKSNQIFYSIEIDYFNTFFNLSKAKNINLEKCNNDILNENLYYENVVNATNTKERFEQKIDLNYASENLKFYLIAQITYGLFKQDDTTFSKTDLFAFQMADIFDLFNDNSVQSQLSGGSLSNRIEGAINFVYGICKTNIQGGLNSLCNVDKIYFMYDLPSSCLQNQNSASFPSFESRFILLNKDNSNVIHADFVNVQNFKTYFKLLSFDYEKSINFEIFVKYGLTDLLFYRSFKDFYNYKYCVEVGTMTNKIKIPNQKQFSNNNFSYKVMSNGIDKFNVFFNCNNQIIDISSDFELTKNINFDYDNSQNLINKISYVAQNSINLVGSVASGNVLSGLESLSNLTELTINNTEELSKANLNNGNAYISLFRNVDFNLFHNEEIYLPFVLEVCENKINKLDFYKIGGANVLKIFDFKDLINVKLTDKLCIREDDFDEIDNESIFLKGLIELCNLPESAKNEIFNLFNNGVYVELLSDSEE